MNGISTIIENNRKVAWNDLNLYLNSLWQISLHILTAWTGLSLFAYREIGYRKFYCLDLYSGTSSKEYHSTTGITPPLTPQVQYTIPLV